MFRTKDFDTGDTRYVARFRAVVLDNRDPVNRGRIVVDHPLFGETVWIPYLRIPNIYDVPCIGDIVYVEADAGQGEFPIAWGNLGKQDAGGQDTSPTTFHREVPTNRGMFSPNGHLIELDDGKATDPNQISDTDLTTESRGLKLTSSSGHKVHLLDDEDNSISQVLLTDKEGDSLIFDAINKKVSLVSKGDYNIDVTGNKVTTIGGSKTETISGDYTSITTGTFDMQSALVKLGEAASFHSAIAENLIAYNDTHIHPAPQAPLGVLDTQAPSVLMSDKAGTGLDVTALFILIKGNV